MKKTASRIVYGVKRGFTLMDSVIALGVLGVALPLSVASLFSSSSLNQDSRQETQSGFIARTVRAELRAAQRGESVVLGEGISPETFSEQQPLVLLIDRSGQIIERGTKTDFDSGSREETVAYIVAVSSSEVAVGRSNDLRLRQVIISVEWPSRARVDKRRAATYIERISNAS